MKTLQIINSEKKGKNMCVCIAKGKQTPMKNALISYTNYSGERRDTNKKLNKEGMNE